jgi:TonB family protein
MQTKSAVSTSILLLNFLWLGTSTTAKGQQAQPSDPMPDQTGVYFVGPEIAKPTLACPTAAVLPHGKSAEKVRGFSVWTLVLHNDGTTSGSELFQSLGAALDASAIEAINQCKFGPAKLHGVAVAVHIGVAVPFGFKDQPAVPRIAIVEEDLGKPISLNLPKANSGNAGPLLIHTAAAAFSDPTFRAKYQGKATLSALIDVAGVPREIKVIHPIGMGLDQRAVAAVNSYRFLPAMKNGQPVSKRITIEVNFLLY